MHYLGFASRARFYIDFAWKTGETYCVVHPHFRAAVVSLLSTEGDCLSSFLLDISTSIVSAACFLPFFIAFKLHRRSKAQIEQQKIAPGDQRGRFHTKAKCRFPIRRCSPANACCMLAVWPTALRYKLCELPSFLLVSSRALIL